MIASRFRRYSWPAVSRTSPVLLKAGLIAAVGAEANRRCFRTGQAAGARSLRVGGRRDVGPRTSAASSGVRER